ncbi:uncharacterized protein LOC106168014 [Lingula anatina]|uniref:Uncharacterized protein LOC106168014 n=1 Tax=Lingula anatina TaxID=7574 RepID=A0A1S3IWP5_LINAN|nr:uncharacterized protein LOC106168014 [Lingula anatina]|eukprot:XP_013402391.1 uncharacterized protein LOC106168014 [Lingula anatina]
MHVTKWLILVLQLRHHQSQMPATRWQLSFIAVTLIVVAAIRHVLHWKSKQKKRKNQNLESNLASSLSKTSHLGYVCAQNTDVLRGDRYIGNTTAIGRDNKGYQSSTERRYESGSKDHKNIRHQPAYKIGQQIEIYLHQIIEQHYHRLICGFKKELFYCHFFITDYNNRIYFKHQNRSATHPRHSSNFLDRELL